jgi:hypothetical protein
VTSRENMRVRSIRGRLRWAPAASWWIALALPLLSWPLLGAKIEKPGLELRANPRASIAPGGRMQSILLSARIVGPEAEQYYCPEVVWLLPNGRSAVESDCDPFEARQHYPRFFKKWVRSPPRPRNYEVCVELRKSGSQVDRACVEYIVR